MLQLIVSTLGQQLRNNTRINSGTTTLFHINHKGCYSINGQLKLFADGTKNIFYKTDSIPTLNKQKNSVAPNHRNTPYLKSKIACINSLTSLLGRTKQFICLQTCFKTTSVRRYEIGGLSRRLASHRGFVHDTRNLIRLPRKKQDKTITLIGKFSSKHAQ